MKSTFAKKILPVLAPVTILLGWFIPVLGFIVPIVMLTAIVLSTFLGRYHCGNYCPRGLFLENWLTKLISQKKKKSLPQWLKSITFRWIFFALMIVMMTFSIAKNPTDLDHLGRVFWFMCTWTTILGLILAAKYKARSWCKICPMGTIQKSFSKSHKDLELNPDSCKTCMLCAKKCPMDLGVIDKDKKQVIPSYDCTKCNVCVSSCPSQSLKWKYKKAA